LLNRRLAKKAENGNPPAGQFLEVNGVRLHYVERGSGAPLVLLHGNGSMIQDFESSGLIDLASKNYRKGLREGAKADLAATSLGGALKFCIEATGVVDLSTMPEVELSGTTAA
jgi:hypothetical protein